MRPVSYAPRDFQPRYINMGFVSQVQALLYMPHSSAKLKGPLYVSSMLYTVPSIQNASFLGPQFSPKSYSVLPVSIFLFSPTEYELLLWAQQCFFCFSLKQLSFSVLNHVNLSTCCISPLDCKLLEGREIVGFCHSCSMLYMIDTSCMVGSETHYNIQENGYN